MYNRDQRFDDRDALSHTYLRSAPSYGDYLRRQTVDKFARFRHDSMRPSDRHFPMQGDVQNSWRRDPPLQEHGWRREGGPPREEFPPRPSFRDERPPFHGAEPSVSWRNETRGGGRFGDRPDIISAPRSENWALPYGEPRDPQRSIAPAAGSVRDEVWRASSSGSSNWRQFNNNPYNGIRPRDLDARDPPRDRRNRREEDSKKRIYSSIQEKNEGSREPPVTKFRDDKGPSHDDTWRTPTNSKEGGGKIKEASPVEEKERSSSAKEDVPIEHSGGSTNSSQKPSLKIHKANFEDVHLYHLPEYKRYVSTGNLEGRDNSRVQSKGPAREESKREDGGHPEKTGSLVIHDAKFEDIHMFHLKGEQETPRSESWLQQYKKRVESVKQQSENRARWQPGPHSYDIHVPKFAEKERPSDVCSYDPPREFNRRASPEPFRGEYFSSAERHYPKEEVPYNQLSAEPTVPPVAESNPRDSYNDFFEPRRQVEKKALPPLPRRDVPFNPNDYVEEFTDDDWNEVADLVVSTGGQSGSNNSPVKQAPVGRRTLLGAAPDLTPSNLSYFRSELPSVRGMKAPVDPQNAHSGDHRRHSSYSDATYDDYPGQQWRDNEDYEGADWGHSRH